MSDHYDYLVIGGGSGGIASARRAAAHGARTALIESGPIGGTCVNVGCVPKKIMWNCAHIAEVLRDAQSYGFDVTRNGFDWARVKRARDAYVARLNRIYHRGLDESGVTKLVGRGRFVDARTVSVNGSRIRADYVLIATGGRPLIPDLPGAELGITSNDFFELQQQPKNILVVGSGYVAVELAGIFNSLGSDVTLLLRGDRLLRTFDPTLRETLTEEMEHAGINILTCVHPQRIERNNQGGIDVIRADGGSISGFDEVLWAIGRRPNTEDLGLEKCGVATDESGFVITDEWQNTNVERIYAVGDVTGRRALTPIAIAAGRRLSDRVFGGRPDAKLDYGVIPSVVFSHPPIGTVGMTEDEAHAEFGDHLVKVYQSRFTNIYYGVLERRAPTVVKLVTVGEHERIVGCHIIGDQADEVIQGFAVAVTMGARKIDFDNTLAIHPTAAEELVTMR